ncbi:hypothetical protein C2845_PM07G01500 [Panicum miliaceum]|uniref:Uncharacterized protein n=1 Tax=Panicum miliaceum TaxID=4540 RepID=A0A3L6SSU7_PANMI|nr:hypothetical protein C2845_PM07G01500 [Panicum miliaceum]
MACHDSRTGIPRSSIHNVYKIISGLSERKKELVESIGFGGLLHFPAIQQINRKFSLWLMSRVNGLNDILSISEDISIQIDKEDIAKVFGIPCGGTKVTKRLFQDKEAVNTIKNRLMTNNRKDVRSIRTAQEIVEKQYEREMSETEMEAFGTAFFIYMMSTLLAPGAKYDYISFEYCNALVNLDEIKSYDCLKEAEQLLQLGYEGETTRDKECSRLKHAVVGSTDITGTNPTRAHRGLSDKLLASSSRDGQKEANENEITSMERGMTSQAMHEDEETYGQDECCRHKKRKHIAANAGHSGCAPCICNCHMRVECSRDMENITIRQRTGKGKINSDIGEQECITSRAMSKYYMCRHGAKVQRSLRNIIGSERIKLCEIPLVKAKNRETQSWKTPWELGGVEGWSTKDADWLTNSLRKYQAELSDPRQGSILAGWFDETALSTKGQFIGPHLSYDVTECRMLFFPGILEHRWVCYAWQMDINEITVFDPAFEDSSSNSSKFASREVVMKLKEAMHTVATTYYDGWDVDFSSARVKCHVVKRRPLAK